VAGELERLHSGGRKWKDFAVLYRQHAHRDELVRELSSRKIPFVISRLSILEHPVVKDVVAYLRLIARPFDDIAGARVLAAPAWGLDARDLVMLAERAKKEKKAIYDALQLPQGELPFDGSRAAVGGLLEFIEEQRKTLRQRSARGILEELCEWLEVVQRVSAQDRKYVTRLTEFAKEWEAKSDTKGLAEFVEYLDYYAQAGGAVRLEDDEGGEAVELMTVHGAKGLEFPQVFVLRVNNHKFPATERARVFEFPAALMKEGAPAEQFHIQEERRLFYVALTRAKERLTLTTLTEKKGKVPVFVEDILMNAAVRRRDVRQMMPRVAALGKASAKDAKGESSGELFPVSSKPPKIFSRIAEWAESFHPPAPEPLQLSPSAVDNYRTCPQRYLFGYLWSLKEGPKATLNFGSIMHNTIKRFVGELRKGNKLAFEEVQRIYEMEWRSVGFEDKYQEAEYKKDGIEQLRAFYADLMAAPPRVLEQEKRFELPLGDNVIVTGRMDQVNALGRNDVEIVDYKTGKPKKEKDARKDLQLSIYALAAREIFELNPVRLIFHYLLNNQVQATTRDAKQLDDAQKLVLEAAEDIRAGEFAAKPGFVCRSCAYRPICPAHEEALSQ
jgi:DNA helicase II / ATP-dependent DNA helicase PcrA